MTLAEKLKELDMEDVIIFADGLSYDYESAFIGVVLQAMTERYMIMI